MDGDWKLFRRWMPKLRQAIEPTGTHVLHIGVARIE